MPKLSQQALEKRFQCPYCDVTLRTRQGLSGHIQFRHKMVTTGKTENTSHIDKVTEFKILRRAGPDGLGITQEEVEEMEEIRADWYFIKKLMGQWNIKLNDADYKTYLFVAAANMYGNQRLTTKLNKELGSAIKQIMEIYNKINNKS